uniref:Histone H1 n=1 Tax=viral metagenome TaxID=1070528 RepID=A0A6M3M3K2_9ZZZZ
MEDLISLLDKMKTALEGAKVDAEKFSEKRNASAGGRVRKAMQDIKKKAQTVRILVQETRKG